MRDMLYYSFVTSEMCCDYTVRFCISSCESCVSGICFVFLKGEKCPHAFCVIEKTLNRGLMVCTRDIYLIA